MTATGGPGRIVLAATPIGDPRDASPRLVELLETADIIAAEDTRRLRRLLATLGVTPRGRVLAHHDHNEADSAAGLVDLARGGAQIVLVTDAGMPAVSDPGYRVVVAAIAADIAVTAVPGPSAVLAALAVSGLATDRFTFEGFPPRKAGERARYLAALTDEPRTMVFFEAPHRLAEVLTALSDSFGADRQAAVCRELTKTHEQVIRGTLADLQRWAGDGVLGEVTLVVAGRPRRALDITELVAEVERLVLSGRTLREASKVVASAADIGARDVYDAAIKSRTRDDDGRHERVRGRGRR